MHQFRVVVLLRMSPFPYALFNCEERGEKRGRGGVSGKRRWTYEECLKKI